MSLLNEALKKHQSESDNKVIPSESPGFPHINRIRSKSKQPRKSFIILLFILIGLTGLISFTLLKYNVEILSAGHNKTMVKHKGENRSNNGAQEKQLDPFKDGQPKQDAATFLNVAKSAKEEDNKNAEPILSRGTIQGPATGKVKESSVPKATQMQQRPHEKAIVHPKVSQNHKHESITESQKHPQNRVNPEARESHGKDFLPVHVRTTQGAKGTKTDLTPFFAAGLRYQRDGRYKEAIRIYTEILKKNPAYKNARINLAAAYLQANQTGRAEKVLARLYRDYPNDTEVLLDYAVVKIRENELLQALELLTRAEKRSKNPQFEILLHKGIVLRKLGRLDEALQAYKAASFLRPGNPKVLLNQAIAYDSAKNYEEAITYYRFYLESTHQDHTLDTRVRNRLQMLYSYFASLKQAQALHNK